MMMTAINLAAQQNRDWLLDDQPYRAEITQESDEISISNGLIRRTFRLGPNAATVAFENVITNETFIRGVKPEADITINGKQYPVGGLIGQPNYAFLIA